MNTFQSLLEAELKNPENEVHRVVLEHLREYVAPTGTEDIINKQ
jgi:hypothetical protein